ncbi:MAG TPA: hypothetical protein EYP58_00900 [bacterium (Candidatus Stahlbacteria)]|nr:hypothetical protein [Candidatus Stahlbacteria bacterium]
MAGLICIRTFSERTEAEVVKGLLESNGIKSYISGKYHALFRPVLKHSLGIRLMVTKGDEQKAKEIIDAFDQKIDQK